jgi:hypothetical protein
VEPWSFAEAREACRKASTAQAAVEEELKKAYRDYAAKEEAYRLALAKEILEQHTQGIAER